MQTLRHIVHPGDAQPSYMELTRQVGPKLLTLGMPALMLRQAVLSLGFTPRAVGNVSLPVDAAAMLGAIAVAYPFELARVLIIN